MAEISKEVIEAYALENAIKHKGKSSESAVLASLFAEGLEKSQIKSYTPKIKKVVKEINSLSEKKQQEKFSKIDIKISKREVREGLPPLPNAKEGKVIMRFAPFPSGPLHIGNARTVVLNDEYAKMYKGELILVFDDTIGSEEKPIEPDAYSLIKEGVRWLGVNYGKQVYKSDRMKTYYEYAEELIKKGYMYVCDCSKEEMHKLRLEGKECPCRQFPPNEQLGRWADMFKAKEGSMVVRLKTDMQDSDPAFRDRVMLRISDRPHPRTAKKYRIYPLLDFSWAIDDHLLGITHILRGIELAIETRTENFIFDIFGWKHPEVIYNGHFALEGVKISKSKGAKEVKSGTYFGWNDPRTWSLQSLRDRGIKPEAIRQFILNMGMKKTSIKVPVDVLYALNKKLVADVQRYFFVEDPQKIRIKGAPPLTAEIPLHPDKKSGFKKYITSQEFLISRPDLELMTDGNYRLMHLLNFRSQKISALVPRDFFFLSEEPEQKLMPKFIHWLPAEADNVHVEIIMPDGKIVKGLGEPELRNLKEGKTVQFERFGFVRLHEKLKTKMKFWFAHY